MSASGENKGSATRAPSALAEVVNRARSNPGANWPSRRAANRLEPDCWPILRPTFKLPPNAKVFAVGSCFARNIEKHLSVLGFNVPSLSMAERYPEWFEGHGTEVLNKYTPPAILHELQWAKAIRDRDDVVATSDIEPFLYEVSAGLFADTRSRSDEGLGLTLDQQLMRRRAIYSIFREAFDCDLAVVTLGFIETWWDRRLGTVAEVNTQILKRDTTGRFEFRRLRYVEVQEHLRAIADLLLSERHTRMLLTTSPIPLSRTFTTDDVIVANTHSKSLLRTAAGELAEDDPRVDYFPSYESVMLTRRPEIWREDLRHVEPGFIGQIMKRVVEAYAETSVALDEYDVELKFAAMVANGDLNGAGDIYEKWKASLATTTRVDAALSVAELHARCGRTEMALAALERAVILPTSEAALRDLRACHVARLCGARDVLAQRQEAIKATLRDDAAECGRLVPLLRETHTCSEADWFRAWAEGAHGKDQRVMSRLARSWELDGRLAKAAALTMQVIPLGPNLDDAAQFALRLSKTEHRADAMELLAAIHEKTGSEAVSRRFAMLLVQDGRFAEADTLLAACLAKQPDDPFMLALHARVLTRLGRKGEALEAGRKAVSLGHDTPQIHALVSRLTPA